MLKTRSYVAFSAIATIALAATIYSAPARASTDPITIEHCFVKQPKAFSHNAGGTQIVYVNAGTKAAKSVTFGVGYRNADSHFYRKVTDVGLFEPGATIDHHFALYSDVTYAGKQTTACKALYVKWADGTTWHQ